MSRMNDRLLRSMQQMIQRMKAYGIGMVHLMGRLYRQTFAIES